MTERIAHLGLSDFTYTGVPVIFWDVFGAAGHPVRTTVSDLGQLLFSRILDLNEVQSGGSQPSSPSRTTRGCSCST